MPRSAVVWSCDSRGEGTASATTPSCSRPRRPPGPASMRSISAPAWALRALRSALARDNAVRNRLADRARSLVLDATAPARSFAAAGCTAGSADRVLMNPPFNAPQHPSPQSARRLAHVAAKDVAAWVRSAARLLRPKGVVTLIWRADGLAQVLDALDRDFGAVAVLPVHARPDAAAVRVLVRAVKSSRSPLALLPGFLLADAAGRPTAEAEAVLREHATLSLADL